MNYTKITKLYKEESLLALKKFLAIPSLYDEKTISETNPYGSNIGEALNFLAELGARYGFNVDKCDGRLVELTYGDGDKLIDIFAHVDVVPATGDWQSDPFVPTIERNVLYARGASDDKGPLIAAFYAIKALKDNGLIRNYRVRLVAGGDEERGSTCLQYYFDTFIECAGCACESGPPPGCSGSFCGAAGVVSGSSESIEAMSANDASMLISRPWYILMKLWMFS